MSNLRQLSQIDEIIIHSADWPNGRRLTVGVIDDWHAQRQFRRNINVLTTHQPSLAAVGYHYVIGVEGEVWPGRALYETGAHVRGHNTRSIGVCLVGTDRFTRAQWVSLAKIVFSLQRLFPNATVHGHNEFSTKTCPGFSVADWVEGELRPLEGYIIYERSGGMT